MVFIPCLNCLNHTASVYSFPLWVCFSSCCPHNSNSICFFNLCRLCLSLSSPIVPALFPRKHSASLGIRRPRHPLHLFSLSHAHNAPWPPALSTGECWHTVWIGYPGALNYWYGAQVTHLISGVEGRERKDEAQGGGSGGRRTEQEEWGGRKGRVTLGELVSERDPWCVSAAARASGQIWKTFVLPVLNVRAQWMTQWCDDSGHG